MRLAALLALPLAVAAPATAAERRVMIGGFERVRVDGPFDVRIVAGRSPGGTISGDAQAVDAVDLRVDGDTLVIQRGHDGAAERPHATAAAPIVVSLGAVRISSAIVIAGGKLSVSAMRGDRIDLSVTGSGDIAVEDASGDALNATVIGAGAVTVAGRVGKARLVTNGPGQIDAGALDAGDLLVRLDGPGATRARARYTATVDNVGLGQVTIIGKPQCTVRAAAGGPVTCGAGG